jgi:anti-sigma-K factor RskA
VAFFSRHDLHVLTGAYALDALDENEQSRYERHLLHCQACLSEVRGLREVATSLAFAASAEPPAELRERVLLLASRTRQLPPDLTSHARRGGWLSRLFRPAGPWLIWMPRLAAVTAVIAVVAAVVLGIKLSSTDQQLNSQRAQSAAIAAVLAAPDASTATGPVSTGGTATVVTSLVRHEVVVSTSGLAALPSGKVYELWLISPAAAHRAGLLPAAVSGRTAPVLASGFAAGDVLGLTVEPAGGTSKPTTTVILALKLPPRA